MIIMSAFSSKSYRISRNLKGFVTTSKNVNQLLPCRTPTDLVNLIRRHLSRPRISIKCAHNRVETPDAGNWWNIERIWELSESVEDLSMDVIEGIKLAQENSTRAFYSYSSPELYPTRSSRINNFLQTFKDDLIFSEQESEQITAPTTTATPCNHFILTVTAEIHTTVGSELADTATSLVSHASTQTLSSGNGKENMSHLLARRSMRMSTRRKNCEPFNKTVGYIHDDEFILMKQAKSGKIWLSDRPEDILVIKEDGRITIPLAAGKSCAKTYPQQIRSRMEKIYDKIFSKKDLRQTDIEWGTSSLDRRATYKYCSSQKRMKISRSETEVSILYPK